MHDLQAIRENMNAFLLGVTVGVLIALVVVVCLGDIHNALKVQKARARTRQRKLMRDVQQKMTRRIPRNNA